MLIAHTKPILGARGFKSVALWSLVTISAAVLAISTVQFLAKTRTNTTIERLRAGANVAVDPADAAPALLEARAAFLLKRNRIEEAQPFLDQASANADGTTRERMLYNMANARMRGAVTAIGKGDYDKAVPFVMLAKAETPARCVSILRLGRQVQPRHRHAPRSRLAAGGGRGRGQTARKPQKLWTDLPGAPKGLP